MKGSWIQHRIAAQRWRDSDARGYGSEVNQLEERRRAAIAKASRGDDDIIAQPFGISWPPYATCSKCSEALFKVGTQGDRDLALCRYGCGTVFERGRGPVEWPSGALAGVSSGVQGGASHLDAGSLSWECLTCGRERGWDRGVTLTLRRAVAHRDFGHDVRRKA